MKGDALGAVLLAMVVLLVALVCVGLYLMSTVQTWWLSRRGGHSVSRRRRSLRARTCRDKRAPFPHSASTLGTDSVSAAAAATASESSHDDESDAMLDSAQTLAPDGGVSSLSPSAASSNSAAEPQHPDALVEPPAPADEKQEPTPIHPVPTGGTQVGTKAVPPAAVPLRRVPAAARRLVVGAANGGGTGGKVRRWLTGFHVVPSFRDLFGNGTRSMPSSPVAAAVPRKQARVPLTAGGVVAVAPAALKQAVGTGLGMAAFAAQPNTSTAQSIFFSEAEPNVLQIFVGFGVNYLNDPRNALPTCINDVKAVRKWWRSVVAVPSRVRYEMYVSDDPERQTAPPGTIASVCRPTVANWQRTLQQIVGLAQQQHAAGGRTEICLMSSSHGSSQKTFRNDELDGNSECVVCEDGLYWDHQFLTDFLVWLPASTHLLALFDSCNSGTVMNLPWAYNRLSQSCDQASTALALQASVWSISGCLDSETSAAGATARDLSVLTDHLSRLLPARRPTASSVSGSVVSYYMNLLATLRQKGEAQLPLLSVSHRSLVSPSMTLLA